MELKLGRVLDMFRMNPSEMKKMLKRMGIAADIEEVEDAERVVIERERESNLLVENPSVTIIRMKGETILYVYGEVKEVSKKVAEPMQKPQIPDEDVQLVAMEANVSLEEARKALEATNGDIAQAIMLIQSRKK
ncbi:MAG: nascent polypeptide-associated complex protein [Desulfurococcales archaeon]